MAMRSGSHGHKAARAWHEEGAPIHRRAGAGGQDLEAQGQEDRCREAGIVLVPLRNIPLSYSVCPVRIRFHQ